MVRGLWDAGLAHRDVKPSNLLVRDGRIVLIDVAFAEVHPSPWRQAVDLANMMLVLALRSDAETVYRQALRYFSPDDLAEAFAASGGVTLPSQSRSMLAQDGRQLLDQFRELAPPRPPVKVQRWSPRRVGLLAGCVVGGAARLHAGGRLGADGRPDRGARGDLPDVHRGAAVRAGGAERAYVPCVPAGVLAELSRRLRRGAQRAGPDRLGAARTGGRIRSTFTAQCRVPLGRPLSRAGLQLGVDEPWTPAEPGRSCSRSPEGACSWTTRPTTLGRAELALPALRDAVRLVPRWRLDRYVARDHRRAGKAPVTSGRSGHGRTRTAGSASDSATTGPSRCRCCGAGCWSPACCCCCSASR